MNRAWKVFLTCVIWVISLLILTSQSPAQVGFGFPPLWDFPSFSNQPLQLPNWAGPFEGKGDILIDNFEYWDSPYNYGWELTEPSYPIYGFGMGNYTFFNTVLDLQQGSRVLDAYLPRSIFIFFTPYVEPEIRHSLFTPPSDDAPNGALGISMAKHDTISFDFRVYQSIYPQDILELDVIGKGYGEEVTLRLLFDSPPTGSSVSEIRMNTTCAVGAYVVESDTNNVLRIDVFMNRGLLDGSWHEVWVNLDDAVAAALEDAGLDPNEWGMETATVVELRGNMFRLDNLMFRAVHGYELLHPELFEMGPLYVPIFEPYRYLFIADYEGIGPMGFKIQQHRLLDFMLDPDNFITDTKTIAKTWLEDSMMDGIVQMDANCLDPHHASYGQPEPFYSTLLGRDVIIDISLPIFSNPRLRMPGFVADDIRNYPPLSWDAKLWGKVRKVKGFRLKPLPIDPYDGMPTYIPAHYEAIRVVNTFGKPHFPPHNVFLLESALWNIGLTEWPNIAALDYTPQYFQDLVVNIEVTNGIDLDAKTFFINTVYSPVENYPPVLQANGEEQILYVGEINQSILNFIDPDCFIFSMSSSPLTSHTPATVGIFRRDMDELRWEMTLYNLPFDEFGFWINLTLDSQSGLINGVPKFETAYDALIFCSDGHGGTALEEFTLLGVNGDTSANHPPVILGGPTKPVVIRAGEKFILHPPNVAVEDPDGDQIYAACNIGTCGLGVDGEFIWKFQSNFPGSYMVEIIFYDIRGGSDILEFQVDVKSWWSYE